MGEDVKVYFDKEIIRVDDDKGTAYKFNGRYIDKLTSEGTLDRDELINFGFDIYQNIFSTKERRDRIKKRLEELHAEENLIISISSEFEDLHNIPFEIINTNGTDTGFLLKKGNISIVRNIPTLDKSFMPVSLPVKILIILSLPLEIYYQSPIDPLKELDIIYNALEEYRKMGIVTIDVEEKADKNTIRDRMLRGQYDIVHFTGHGRRGGKLLIEDETENARGKLIDADELREIFRDTSVKLFYFDACETAEASEFEPSLAYHIYKGVPSAQVIANIVSVRDDIATATTKHIYQSVFKNSLGNVLNKARLMIHEDWWKPVIFGSTRARLLEPWDKTTKPEEKKRIILRPPDTAKNYVYRYGIVRAASNLIEEQNYLVLHGIGGAGKSTLAHYLSKFYDAEFTHILFFDLKDRNILQPETLLDEMLNEMVGQNFIGYEKIAGFFNESIPQKILNRQKWDFIKTTLHDRTLLILDNLETTIQDDKGIIKAEWKDLSSDILNTKGVFTIFTSRLNVRLSDRKYLENTLEIGEYTGAEVGFLYKGLKDGRQQEYLSKKIDEIHEKFGLHPLSIAKAIEERSAELDKLLMTEDFKGFFEFYRDYFKRYAEDTKRLFYLAYPFSDTFMENVLSPDFVSLVRNSLMILIAHGGLYSLYKIIRAYFKKDYPMSEEEIIGLKNDLITGDENKQFSPYDLLNIFSVLLDSYEIKKESELEERLSHILGSIGTYNLQSHISFEQIERFSKMVQKSSLGEEVRAGTLNNIGNLYSGTGRMKEAGESYEEALRIRRQLAAVRPEYLPDVAMTLNNIGNLYSDTGRMKEAGESYEEALRIRRQLAAVRPEYLPDVAMTLNNLGVLYRDTGRMKEAGESYEEALRIRRQLAAVRPEYLPNVAMTLNNIGNLYSDTGRMKEAGESYEEASRIYRQLAAVRPEYLPDVAMTLNNIGNLYRGTGRMKEAGESYEEALRIYRQLAAVRPEYLPDVAMTLNNLGVLYRDTGRMKEAGESYEEALRIRRQLAAVRPEYLPNVATTLNNIGNLYRGTGRMKEAGESYEEALRIRRQLAAVRPEYLPNVATTLNNLGVLYRDTGRMKEAGESYEEASRIYRQLAAVRPEYLPDVATTLNNLGVLYSDTGRMKEAGESYEEALRIRRQLAAVRPEYLPNVATTLNNLGVLYRDTGRMKEAGESYEEALAIRKKTKDYQGQFTIYPYLISIAIKLPESGLSTDCRAGMRFSRTFLHILIRQ